MPELLHGDITEKILGAAFEVHTALGPGLLESVYEEAMVHELRLRGMKVERQVRFKLPYKEIFVGEFVVDLLVEDKVIVELKATTEHHQVFETILLYYLRGPKRRVGLILNFGTESLYRKRLVV